MANPPLSSLLPAEGTDLPSGTPWAQTGTVSAGTQAPTQVRGMMSVQTVQQKSRPVRGLPPLTSRKSRPFFLPEQSAPECCPHCPQVLSASLPGPPSPGPEASSPCPGWCQEKPQITPGWAAHKLPPSCLQRKGYHGFKMHHAMESIVLNSIFSFFSLSVKSTSAQQRHVQRAGRGTAHRGAR